MNNNQDCHQMQKINLYKYPGFVISIVVFKFGANTQ